MKRATLALLLAALLPAGVYSQTASQTATLVRDINPQPPVPASPEASPRQLAVAGGRAVFITREEPEGEDPAEPAAYLLWATDGSAAGTSALLRLCSPCGGEPQRVAELPGLAFNEVVDADAVLHLWRTDGTRAGTFPLAPPLAVPVSDYGPPSVTVLGRRLLFGACVELLCSLWSTDGSAAGTTRLQEPLTAYGLVVAGDRAFFQGTDGRGTGLWVTDGTAAGTRLVRLVDYTAYLTASGSRVFFLTGGDDYPEDLWTSDGTQQGTRFLRKFYEPNHYVSSVTNFLKPVPGGVLLVGSSGGSSAINLWRSDGTAAGTRQITSFPDRSSVAGLQWSQIAVLGSRIFFVTTNATGPRLWSTQGSAATSAPVTGCPGGCPALRPDSQLIPAGGRIVFVARDLVHGTEPWTSDGTGAGTRLLRDLCAGACDSAPEAFTAHDGRIDFRATWNGRTRLVRTDGTVAVPLAPLPPAAADSSFQIDLADVGTHTFFTGFDSQGLQPWVTDGTAVGSRRIGSLGNSGGSDPKDSVALGGRLLLTASDGLERSVWTVDSLGQAAPLPGTGVPVDRPGPSALTVSGGLAYFVSDRGTDGVELWRTDGSAAGTLRLATFQHKALSDLRDLGGRLVFLATSTDGEQPVFSFWKSDGTPPGTGGRFDLPADTVGITDVTALGPELYFLLHREAVSQIFRSDGTAGGTRMIFQQDCDCALFDSGVDFLRSNGRVYFSAWGDFTLALYQTDGTAAGTVQVVPSPDDPSADSLYPQAFFEFQGNLYYFAANPDQDSSVSWILWKGRTAATAAPVKTVGFQYYDPVTPEYTVLGGRLYFRAWDPDHGFELWRTDGTAAGTVLVRDIAPGDTSSDPQGLVAAGGRLWFSALDPDHGRELWTSDGTRQGTRLVEDLAPGPASAAPEQLTPFAGRLCFTADDGITGREPWCLPLDPR
jgi:ELWxxDGT repeat protein